MDTADVPLQHHLPPPTHLPLPNSLRNLQPAALSALHHHQPHSRSPQAPSPLHHHNAGLSPHLATGLDPSDPNLFRTGYGHEVALGGEAGLGFEHSALPHLQQHGLPPQQYTHAHSGNQYGMVGSGAHMGSLGSAGREQSNGMEGMAPPEGFALGGDGGVGGGEEHGEVPVKYDGQFEGLKLIPNPPDLECWRQKLFCVDETMVLTEDQFQTYFPHVDNVYSHRSTQRYKRKPFVSHYWDCRLKGRPPGTKKSTDPEKKKRKRVARERDLCDVKIKITEYMPGTVPAELFTSSPQNGSGGPSVQGPTQQQLDALSAGGFYAQQSSAGEPWGITGLGMGPSQGKYYTIQRVNGNGANGKSVESWVAGPHKHTLEDSDRVKKNSVVRYMMKSEKEKKKVQGGEPQKKTYHKKATGKAATTVKAHSKEEDLKLYGSCFCPFVQRVWISLELKGMAYQYIEVDPYKKPQSLLEVNPRGLVPALRHGPTWSCHESTVLMEYLEELHQGPPLLPADPRLRATCRLWSDHINRHLIPGFYHLLQSQDSEKQLTLASELQTHIDTLVAAAEKMSPGPFFLGSSIGFVDVQMAPWVIRLNRVLKPYRSWPEPEEGTRWACWVRAIEHEASVERTTSTDELYLDSYERYAENRPNTSQLANAVNSGRGLP